jgi:hypothetical protein
MVERTKATVLKTVGPGNRSRGFESHSLRGFHPPQGEVARAKLGTKGVKRFHDPLRAAPFPGARNAGRGPLGCRTVIQEA